MTGESCVRIFGVLIILKNQNIQFNWERSNLKVHINAIHRQLKPWKCSDCPKGRRIKTYH